MINSESSNINGIRIHWLCPIHTMTVKYKFWLVTALMLLQVKPTTILLLLILPRGCGLVGLLSGHFVGHLILRTCKPQRNYLQTTFQNSHNLPSQSINKRTVIAGSKLHQIQYKNFYAGLRLNTKLNCETSIDLQTELALPRLGNIVYDHRDMRDNKAKTKIQFGPSECKIASCMHKASQSTKLQILHGCFS